MHRVLDVRMDLFVVRLRKSATPLARIHRLGSLPPRGEERGAGGWDVEDGEGMLTMKLRDLQTRIRFVVTQGTKEGTQSSSGEWLKEGRGER